MPSYTEAGCVTDPILCLFVVASAKVKLGDSFDKGLVFGGMHALGHGQRLPMRFRLEFGRAYIRHPNLDRAQILGAQR